MTDLSELAKRLQEQVDVLTTYLAEQKLPSPSFIPSDHPMKSPLDSLPPAIEAARNKAIGLSWNLHKLLQPPRELLWWLSTEVPPTTKPLTSSTIQ
jgi:hypothetical protein